MRPVIKYFITLFVAISVAVTPAVSVFASLDSGVAAYLQATSVDPCHEVAAGDVVKNEPTKASDAVPCEDCCKNGACQVKLCSSCGNPAQSSAISPMTFLSKHSTSNSYQRSYSEGYPSLRLSPAFRPPIR
jgi:hypothetical protein